MKKEDLLNDDFLKQFKASEELNDFLSDLQKRSIEKMLEGELDAPLGYDKNQKSANANSRNGYACLNRASELETNHLHKFLSLNNILRFLHSNLRVIH